MTAIGRLKDRITVEKWTAVEQPGGGISESWAADTDVSTDGKTWAEMKPLSSKRMVVGDKVAISDGYKCILRWTTSRIMDQKRRIVYKGQNLTISGAIELREARNYWQLTCLVNG